MILRFGESSRTLGQFRRFLSPWFQTPPTFECAIFTDGGVDKLLDPIDHLYAVRYVGDEAIEVLLGTGERRLEVVKNAEGGSHDNQEDQWENGRHFAVIED